MRKSKWENWKKTQAMFYNKTSTNYQKWDFFEAESDSDDEEKKEPIVPNNDPAFKAMEADMLDRKKRRTRDTKEALGLKDRGNDFLKKGLYKSAIKFYSDAMDLRRDLLPLFTNRALARVKIDDFQGAIDDCTKLLEYCEVFHDGFDKEKDLCFKALTRRCLAMRGIKDYALALQDLEEADKLFPGDKDVQRLKALTLEDIEMERRVASIMENADALKGKEWIDFLLKFLQGQNDEQKTGESAKRK